MSEKALMEALCANYVGKILEVTRKSFRDISSTKFVRNKTKRLLNLLMMTGMNVNSATNHIQKKTACKDTFQVSTSRNPSGISIFLILVNKL